MNKLSHTLNDEWTEYSHSPESMRDDLTTGAIRLEAGLPPSEIEVLRKLLLHMEQPICILYVLHTPRAGEILGDIKVLGSLSRQSRISLSGSQASWEKMQDLTDGFTLLRHVPQLWGDRYNNGLLEEFEAELKRIGFSQGESLIPVPHTHQYHEECDGDAAAVLSDFDWRKSGLRQEDEQ